ncbi:terminase GpA [Solidesulfovibrio fructosivorans JJ]]|uniref:Terminase GpA n=1 Tax=Solidesulfovibrio fructosivorans JJ] TaxID=596151 RepID=E1JR22_SOLFR|nr:terminase gpA endonuclease subunit [Solidesulfovibrio fructosivorans]EFL53023.1 terminase GpA [Solidesulfovibrio fructosivorans JJ]]
MTVPEFVCFRFTDAERRIFRKRVRPQPSVWAAQNIVVQDGPFAGSRLRMDVTPYMPGIIDTLYQPGVEEVGVCASPQISKSELLFASLFYSMEFFPGPKLVAMPDEDTLTRAVEKKLLPRIRGSATLRRLFYRYAKGAFELTDGSPVYLASSQSPAQRASVTVMHEFLDEIDLYRQLAGQGAPITEFEERTISYGHKRKILKISKPMGDETSAIWIFVTIDCDELRRWQVPCSACGTVQIMHEDHVVVLEHCKDPREIKRRKLGRYKCPHCGYLWTDHARNQAVARGEWIADEPVLRPRAVGFHLPALVSPFVSLSEFAADKLTAENSDDDRVKRDYANGRCAKPFKAIALDTKEETVLSRRAMWLPAKTVPVEAVALTCGIDVQMDSFWFSVLAWGREMQSWLVDYGQLRTWEDVMGLVHGTRYPVLGRDGSTLGIWRAGIDSGGNKTKHEILTRTEEVYSWCRARGDGRLFPIKGRSRDYHVNVSWTTIDKLPHSGRPIPGGLQLYLLDVNSLKRLLYKRLRQDAKQPMLLHGQTGEDYARHLAAERLVKDRAGNYVWEQLSDTNHLLDATMIAHACADDSWTPSLSYLLEQEHEETTKPRETPRPDADDRGSILAAAASRASAILANR